MTDMEIQEQRQLWAVLRDSKVPPAARVRVLAQIEEQQTRPARWPLLAVPLVAAMALALWMRAPNAIETGGHKVVAAQLVSQDGQPLQAGDRTAGGMIQVAPGGHLQLALSDGEVEISGEASIVGPDCTAKVSGTSRISLVKHHMQVTVFAGSAHVEPAQTTCSVLFVETEQVEPEPDKNKAADSESNDPIALGESEEAEETEAEETEPEKTARVRKDRKAFTDVELNQQSAAYWHAQKLRKSDAKAALGEFRVFKKKWPRSPLRQEIDLATIDTLLQMGLAREAQRSARRFVKRYPKSPRISELKALMKDER